MKYPEEDEILNSEEATLAHKKALRKPVIDLTKFLVNNIVLGGSTVLFPTQLVKFGERKIFSEIEEKTLDLLRKKGYKITSRIEPLYTECPMFREKIEDVYTTWYGRKKKLVSYRNTYYKYIDTPVYIISLPEQKQGKLP